MKCQICESDTEFIDNYKFNVKYDENIFGKMKVYNCANCEFSFSYPEPKEETLNDYYKNVYRDIGRPHFYDETSKLVISEKNMSYLSYLNNIIKIEKIKNVFDIGSGSGEFGFLLKNKFKNVELFCSEIDKFSIKHLESREHKNYENIENIDKRFDLLVSLHSFEHFPNINIFFEILDKIIKKNGYLFFEVPNCPFNEGFDKRPYDSPHLLFFTKKSLEIMFKKKGYKILNIVEFGPSLKTVFKNMENFKKDFENWTPEKKIKNDPVSVLKRLLPKKVKKFIKMLFLNTEQSFEKIEDFTDKNEQGWAVRGIVQKID